jgi:phosphoribosylformylglycinamidine cyclo-ligase
MGVEVNLDSWQPPAVFQWLAEVAGIPEREMLKTFNCGIGMILVVAEDRADALTTLLQAEGETVTRLGTIVEGQGVIYKGRLL